MRRTAVLWIVLVAAIMVAAPLRAAGPTATVRGVEAVNVRRGPSPDSPAFAMLRKGAQVRVESTEGAWALVQLADGERGYIHAAYLALPPGVSVPTVVSEPTATATSMVDATPTGAPPLETSVVPTEGAATPVDTPAAVLIERRLEQALERIRALESARTDPAMAPDATPRHGDTPLPLGIEPPTPNDEYGDFRDFAPSFALAGVGFAVGFLLGVAYGQRQERHRRGRVRF